MIIEDILAEATAKLQKRIDSGEITTARQADEAAGDIAQSYGLDLDCPEYERLITALCRVAGDELPGEW